jgi:hypothetical protein
MANGIGEVTNGAVEGVILLRALNFFSPRSFSFIAFVKGEGFINPFFRLLDFPNRNIKMS